MVGMHVRVMNPARAAYAIRRFRRRLLEWPDQQCVTVKRLDWRNWMDFSLTPRMGMRGSIEAQLKMGGQRIAPVFLECNPPGHSSGSVGSAMTPLLVLKAGDRVRCEIDKLGAEYQA
jgi:hypothetical protein